MEKLEKKCDLPDLNQLVRNYGQMVSSLCSRMIFDPTVAEEAAQETWLEIIRSINSFQNKSKISTWIYTITRRVVIRYSQNEKQYTTKILRKYFRSDDQVENLPDEKQDLSVYVKEQCDKCLVGILHCLDSESRLLYIMRDIAGISYKDISYIFEKSETALRKNISRSRNKLRCFLNEECYLFNPKGNCKCRMKTFVEKVELEYEFDKMRRIVNKMYFFKEVEEIFPRKNYWEKYLV